MKNRLHWVIRRRRRVNVRIDRNVGSNLYFPCLSLCSEDKVIILTSNKESASTPKSNTFDTKRQESPFGSLLDKMKGPSVSLNLVGSDSVVVDSSR